MTAFSENETLLAPLPKTLEEFMVWQQTDGFKYEWNNGEIIQLRGMDIKQLFIFEVINDIFNKKEFWKKGTLVAEQNIILNDVQLRRPDIAYFTKLQVQHGRNGGTQIPEFIIEVISTNDKPYQIEKKITEYFKAGVKVIWNIYPEPELVYVFTSRKQVQICMEDDICSATTVLPEFEVKVSEIFG